MDIQTTPIGNGYFHFDVLGAVFIAMAFSMFLYILIYMGRQMFSSS